MHPGPDNLGAPSSFAARRPNASNLPIFELPPPPSASLPSKFPPFHSFNGSQPSPAPSSVASVGHLLTPPSNLPGDALSPVSSGVTSNGSSTSQGMQSYNSGYVWSPPTQGNTPYGFSSQGSQYGGGQSRGLPPPQYESNVPSFSASSTMSAPPAMPPSLPSQQSMPNGLPSQTATSGAQHSPLYSQGHQPPTPTYYAHQTSTPQGSSFPYSAGPSPTQHSPLSAGPMSRVPPNNGQGPVSSMVGPSAPSYGQQRPFGSYPLPGPVLSNVGNPNGQPMIVGPHGLMGFNSGHAANIQHLYGSGGPHHHHQHHQQHHAGGGGPGGPHPPPATDRPYKCDQCPQSFNRNHDLKRHKRIHLAVKPFPCGHCDKSFSRKDALKRHILVKGCGKASAAADGNSGSGGGSGGGSGAGTGGAGAGGANGSKVGGAGPGSGSGSAASATAASHLDGSMSPTNTSGMGKAETG